MKIAVLLTGQLRTIDFTKKILKDSFPSADFFLSIDKNNKQQNLPLNSTKATNKDKVKLAIDYFKPKNYYINNGLPESFNNKFRFPFYFISKHHKKNNLPNYKNYLSGNIFQECQRFLPKIVFRSGFKKLFEQYFYVKQAFQIMQEYELDQGFQYDIVIRLRFDQLIYNAETIKRLHPRMGYNLENISHANDSSLAIDINLNNILDGHAVVFGHGNNGNYYIINDQHFIAKRKTAIAISCFYDELSEIIKDSISTNCYPTHYAQVEYFFCRHMMNHGIKLIKSESLNYGGMFIRDKVTG
jgi:hypothetical protein